MIAIAVHGAAGRMGRSVIEAVTEDPDAKLVAAFERPGNPALGQDAAVLAGRGALGVALDADIERGLGAAQVVIDFSSPAAASALFALCARRARARSCRAPPAWTPTCKAALERARAKRCPWCTRPTSASA